MQFRNIPIFLGLALLTGACSNTRTCSPSDCIDQTYVHKYGVRVRPDYWVERGQNGQVVSTLRDGVVVTQSYNAGELHGESCYTFPNSTKVAKSEYYENNNLQKENEFYPSGVPKETCEWHGPNNCTVTCWYECGTPRCVEKMEDGRLLSGKYYNKNNECDSWVYNGEGERYSRDCNGNFICHDDFHGGEVIRRTYYYPSKGPKEVIGFSEGVPHGERKTFYPDGSPCTIETWDCGHRNGTTVIFQNGERYAEVPYLAGKRNGIERRFADGYNLSQEVTWYNDQMHGPTYTYVGDSTQTDWFYKGRMTTRSNYESYNSPCR